MKTERAVISGVIVAVILVAFFTVPLPVSRVRQVCLVALQDQAEAPVLLREDGRLEMLHVVDGQPVQKGDILAVLRNRDLERKRDEAETQYQIYQAQCDELERKRAEQGKNIDPRRMTLALVQAQSQRDTYKTQRDVLNLQIESLTLRAPRDGLVINPPHIDEVGKYFDRQQPAPFCTIGDPTRLRVLVPVKPSDYRLLKKDREALAASGKDLEVTIRIHGRDSHTWQGEWQALPESEAKTIPLPLSNKAGGPIPVKPNSSDPNRLEPINQQYMLSIAIVDPDGAICPGSLGQVKINCRWQSGAWWVWRTINDTFDLGLM